MISRECDIGSAADYADRTAYRVEAAGRTIVVVRNGNTFYALRDECPHQGAPLSAGRVAGTVLQSGIGEPVGYGRADKILRCPWHGWEFDLETGRSLVDPHRACVRAYPVRFEGGRVIVQMT